MAKQIKKIYKLKKEVKMAGIQRKNLSKEDEIQSENKERTKHIWAVTGVGIVILAFILFFALNSESNYESGEKYLKQKQYAEALAEFQKVEPEDQEFRMSRSKISYINGLLAFNEGLKSEAKSYLLRVDNSDEYYNESQLMIDKINMASKAGDLEKLSESLRGSKDTVIILEKTEDKFTETGTISNTGDKSKIYILSIEKIVRDFESHYMVAIATTTDSKAEYVTMDSLYKKFLRLDDSGIGSEAVQLKEYADQYMQKRIDYIQMKLTESTAGETTELKYLKEDGDKIYSKVINQINKVN